MSIITAQAVDEEDITLRPTRLSQIHGQKEVREALDVAIVAARFRGEALDHTLLYGPPGLGKTTFAFIIANEMHAPCVEIVNAATVSKPSDLSHTITSMQAGGVLFIDEIHSLPRDVEEMLYTVMEDSRMDMVVGKGDKARTITVDLPRFTIIGATTQAGLLSAPLRDRFGLPLILELYDVESLTEITFRSAKIMDVPITETAALQIASRSRGTPRIVNRLLKRCRDYAQAKSNGTLTGALTEEALSEHLKLDENGLTKDDYLVLEALTGRYSCRPVGSKTFSLAVNMAQSDLEGHIEPFLLRLGLMDRTAGGRVALAAGYEYLGLPVPKNL